MRLLRLMLALCMAPVLLVCAPVVMAWMLGRWVWTGFVPGAPRPIPVTTATPPSQDEARRLVQQVMAAQRRAQRN